MSAAIQKTIPGQSAAGCADGEKCLADPSVRRQTCCFCVGPSWVFGADCGNRQRWHSTKVNGTSWAFAAGKIGWESRFRRKGQTACAVYACADHRIMRFAPYVLSVPSLPMLRLDGYCTAALRPDSPQSIGLSAWVSSLLARVVDSSQPGLF